MAHSTSTYEEKKFHLQENLIQAVIVPFSKR